MKISKHIAEYRPAQTGDSILPYILHEIAHRVPCRDSRITLTSTAIRYARTKGLLPSILAEARSAKCGHSDVKLRYRPDFGSGRSGDCFRTSWIATADGVADLIRRGMSATDARRISRTMMRGERVDDAVADPLPGDIDITPSADDPHEATLWGWGEAKAAKLGVSLEHVRRWHHWRKHIRSLAGSGRYGRSTRRFWSAAEKIAKRQRAERIAKRIEDMTPVARSLAESLSAVLPRSELGSGWICGESSIETTHTFAAETCPGWDSMLASMGITVHQGGCLGISSSSHRISGAPIGAARFAASRVKDAKLAVYDRCAA